MTGAEQEHRLYSENITQTPKLRIWVPENGNYEILGSPVFWRRPQCTQIITIIMYFLIGIRQNILIQCYGIFFLGGGVCKKYIYIYKFENHILRNKYLGVLRGDFWGFGCANDTQMPCWLRLWYHTFLWTRQGLWWTPAPVWMPGTCLRRCHTAAAQ